jgi:hypothetical protein
MTTKPKAVLVVGPGSTGSVLIAKTIAAALNIAKWGTWNGTFWVKPMRHPGNNVLHLSVPNRPERVKGTVKWRKILKHHDICYIIPTRDLSCCDLSRGRRFNPSRPVRERSFAASKRILRDIIDSKYRHMFWSYETFMCWKEDYLKILWDFIGIESDFIPPLKDGNKKYIMDEEAT